MLNIQDLSIRFGGIEVLKGLTLDIEAGQIHSVIGPNGAGKTTLFNIVTGLYKPKEGIVQFEGELLNPLKPHRIAQLGISRTFQNIRLFPHMTVVENMQMGQSMRIPSGLTSLVPFIHRKKQRELNDEIHRVLDLLGFESKAGMLAGQLAYGEQKRLEIGRALCAGAKLILLDEPAAGLNPEESSRLNELIQNIRSSGVTVLLIEHDMSVVMSISDKISVINFGQKIAEGTPVEIQNHPDVVEAYLGREEAV